MYDRSMQKWHDIYLNNGCIREHKIDMLIKYLKNCAIKAV